MKINIAVNKNGFYDIELKIANTTKRIYNASEMNIRNNIENEQLTLLLINQIKVMNELQMKSISFQKRIKFM